MSALSLKVYESGVTCNACVLQIIWKPDAFNEITDEPEQDDDGPKHTLSVGSGRPAAGAACLDEKEKKKAQLKNHTANDEARSAAYNQLATALGETNPDYKPRTKATDEYLYPRAADAILELMPPPEWSEADEAAWEPFLKGKKGDD